MNSNELVVHYTLEENGICTLYKEEVLHECRENKSTNLTEEIRERCVPPKEKTFEDLEMLVIRASPSI